jgi:hypothetical protein
VALPPPLLAGQRITGYDDWRLADETAVHVPRYAAMLRIGDLAPFSVRVIALGAQTLVGRAAIARYRVVLDRGRSVTVEP